MTRYDKVIKNTGKKPDITNWCPGNYQVGPFHDPDTLKYLNNKVLGCRENTCEKCWMEKENDDE